MILKKYLSKVIGAFNGNDKFQHHVDQVDPTREAKIILLKKQKIPIFQVWSYHSATIKKFRMEKDTLIKAMITGRLMTPYRDGEVSILHQGEHVRVKIHVETISDPTSLHVLEEIIDPGDIIGISGIFSTLNGGLLYVSKAEIVVLSKALCNPFIASSDVRSKVYDRHRELYYLNSKRQRQLLRMRHELFLSLRRFLNEHSFIEIDTPIFELTQNEQSITNKVSVSHYIHNQNLHIAIASEEYLKRLLVSGFERIYEIRHRLRPDPISLDHHPEFSVLELYQAYSGCDEMMDLTEKIITYVASRLFDTLKFRFREIMVDLTPPWGRLTLNQIITRYTSLDEEGCNDSSRLTDEIKQSGISIPPHSDIKSLTQYLFEHAIATKIVQPTFILYPTKIPQVELFMASGLEIANISSLNIDPYSVERIYQSYRHLRPGPTDEEYLFATRYGIPPSGGCSIGLDRLLMLFGNCAITNTIPFPMVIKSPKQQNNHDRFYRYCSFFSSNNKKIGEGLNRLKIFQKVGSLTICFKMRKV